MPIDETLFGVHASSVEIFSPFNTLSVKSCESSLNYRLSDSSVILSKCINDEEDTTEHYSYLLTAACIMHTLLWLQGHTYQQHRR